MTAHDQGRILNAAQLASLVGVSGHTVASHLNIMVDLLLVLRLQPWAANTKKRLVQTPKFHVPDSSLLHALLNIRARLVRPDLHGIVAANYPFLAHLDFR